MNKLNLNKCGVYKITNLITKEFYIGSSSNIKRRWAEHKQRSKHMNKEYNKALYESIRKYGLENFNIKILEECEEVFLLEREQFYIKKLKAISLGFNQEKGLDSHGKALLTLQDVIDIRTRYKNRERKKDVYQDYSYKINKSGFHKVWNGYTWASVMPEVFSDENKKFHTNNTAQKGSENGRSSLTEKDVIKIRTLKREGKTKEEVYEEYKNKVTSGSFKNTWYGYNWKHVIV